MARYLFRRRSFSCAAFLRYLAQRSGRAGMAFTESGLWIWRVGGTPRDRDTAQLLLHRRHQSQVQHPPAGKVGQQLFQLPPLPRPGQPLLGSSHLAVLLKKRGSSYLFSFTGSLLSHGGMAHDIELLLAGQILALHGLQGVVVAPGLRLVEVHHRAVPVHSLPAVQRPLFQLFHHHGQREFSSPGTR